MIPPGDDLSGRAQAVIDRSETLGQVTALGTTSPDSSVRELAGLQLLAAAASDLGVAGDLAQMASGDLGAQPPERGAILPAAISELRAILTAPPEMGMRGLLEKELGIERSARPLEAMAARQALREAVEGALEDIMDDAASVGRVTLLGLLEVPAPPMKVAASVAVHALVTELGDEVSTVLRKAAGMLVCATDKVLKALGRQATPAREDAVVWISMLEGTTLFGLLLDRLYESKRIRQEVAHEIGDAPASLEAATFNKASQQVARLAAGYAKQKSAITWVARGLAAARLWALGIEPWGPLALTAAYLAVIGYTVYLGGDYVDWYRVLGSGRLGLVRGVRTTVRGTLSEAGS
jgi:hypothetical protein